MAMENGDRLPCSHNVWSRRSIPSACRHHRTPHAQPRKPRQYRRRSFVQVSVRLFRPLCIPAAARLVMACAAGGAALAAASASAQHAQSTRRSAPDAPDAGADSDSRQSTGAHSAVRLSAARMVPPLRSGVWTADCRANLRALAVFVSRHGVTGETISLPADASHRRRTSVESVKISRRGFCSSCLNGQTFADAATSARVLVYGAKGKPGRVERRLYRAAVVPTDHQAWGQTERTPCGS